jgi:hypothetical protein
MKDEFDNFSSSESATSGSQDTDAHRFGLISFIHGEAKPFARGGSRAAFVDRSVMERDDLRR